MGNSFHQSTHGLIIALLLPILLSSAPSAQAGWVDDWIDQKTETAPGYFEGQKRGYYTAGSFSARWKENQDYLLSVEAPKLKAGCGGIDFMNGSMTLLTDAQYLRDKLSRITSEAFAVFAFDIGLKTVCPQCSETMSKLESMADRLNQLQMSDCKAGKAIAAYINPSTRDAEKRAVSEAAQSYASGVRTGWGEVRDAWKGNNDEPTLDNQPTTAGCPLELKNIFGGGTKTVLQTAGDMRNYKAEYMDLARGLVGDLKIELVPTPGGTKTYAIREIAPCPENKKLSMASFLSGDIYKRPPDGSACRKVPDLNSNLEKWSQNRLTQIVTSIKNNTRLSVADENYLNTIPLPVYRILKSALTDQNDSSAIEMTLASIGARAYAFGMINDLYEMVNNNIRLIQSVVSAQGSKGFGRTCAIEDRIASVQDQLRTMSRNVSEQALAMGEDYKRATMGLVATLKITELISRGSGKDKNESKSATVGN